MLLGAPLCFEPSENQFRDALVTLVPQDISDADPFPGSLLSHASALASPRAFIWSRLMDAAMSTTDPFAMAIHARVERWALDEIPLPGKLVLLRLIEMVPTGPAIGFIQLQREHIIVGFNLVV